MISRADRGLALLERSRAHQKPPEAKVWPEGLGWVPLPELQRELGAQHGARLKELRDRGHDIENSMMTRDDGTRLSWYRLSPSQNPTLFELAPADRSYRE
jgi:hypothetical protein